MGSEHIGAAAHPGRVAAAVVVVLAASNVLTSQVLPSWSYVPWNVTIAGLVVLIARRAVTLEEIGFTRWRSGAVWGGTLFAVTSVALSLAIMLPVFDELFRDRRVGESSATWLYQAFVRIPLGTALLEETAFRGVLPALYSKKWGVVSASLLASVWFGLWHILPALHLNEVNPSAERWLGHGALGVTVGVVFAVLGTFAVGLWWCWVRYRSGSLLSTFLGHVAANSMAYTIAFLVNH